MIPCVFIKNKGTKSSTTGAKAEYEVYKALQGLNDTESIITSLTNNEKCGGFVYHGQKFSSQEIDFVYVSIHGLLVIECKGTVGVKQLKYDQANAQLERQVPELLRVLDLPENIPIFKVVAFPCSSQFDVKVVGETRCLFKNDMNDFKTWLRIFFEESNDMCFETYIGIVKKFLQKYHSSKGKITNRNEFKKRAISDCSDSLERFYTKEQATILNLTDNHFNDAWIIGAAGTGKTLVLKDLVGKFKQDFPEDYKGKPRILVITYNTPVNKDIE